MAGCGKHEPRLSVEDSTYTLEVVTSETIKTEQESHVDLDYSNSASSHTVYVNQDDAFDVQNVSENVVIDPDCHDDSSMQDETIIIMTDDSNYHAQDLLVNSNPATSSGMVHHPREVVISSGDTGGGMDMVELNKPVHFSRRLRLRPWLEMWIDSGEIDGLYWIEREKKIFAMPWKHRAGNNWKESDGKLYREWALHTGKYVPGRDLEDPGMWKANFRCALNSLPDLVCLASDGIKKGNRAHKIYQMVDKDSQRRKTKLDRKISVRQTKISDDRTGMVDPLKPHNDRKRKLVKQEVGGMMKKAPEDLELAGILSSLSEQPISEIPSKDFHLKLLACAATNTPCPIVAAEEEVTTGDNYSQLSYSEKSDSEDDLLSSSSSDTEHRLTPFAEEGASRTRVIVTGNTRTLESSPGKTVHLIEPHPSPNKAALLEQLPDYRIHSEDEDQQMASTPIKGRDCVMQLVPGGSPSSNFGSPISNYSSSLVTGMSEYHSSRPSSRYHDEVGYMSYPSTVGRFDSNFLKAAALVKAANPVHVPSPRLASPPPTHNQTIVQPRAPVCGTLQLKPIKDKTPSVAMKFSSYLSSSHVKCCQVDICKNRRPVQPLIYTEPQVTAQSRKRKPCMFVVGPEERPMEHPDAPTAVKVLKIENPNARATSPVANMTKRHYKKRLIQMSSSPPTSSPTSNNSSTLRFQSSLPSNSSSDCLYPTAANSRITDTSISMPSNTFRTPSMSNQFSLPAPPFYPPQASMSPVRYAQQPRQYDIPNQPHLHDVPNHNPLEAIKQLRQNLQDRLGKLERNRRT